MNFSPRWRHLLATLVSGVVAFTAARSHAVQLWGILRTTNQIVRVNPVTGDVFAGFTTPGGAVTPTQEFGGLTIAEGGAVMLYQNPVTNPTSLYRINPDNGALLSTEFMPTATNPQHRAGLSFESGAGVGGLNVIFAVNNGSPVQRQDGYGDVTLSDHTGPGATFAGALGGDDNGRQFLAGGGASIWEFSASSPNVLINTLPAPQTQSPYVGLAFDGERIYLSALSGQLWTIDPNTGAVLNSVLVNEGGLIGLAARGVPEPSVLALAGCAVCCIRGFRCRRGNPR